MDIPILSFNDKLFQDCKPVLWTYIQLNYSVGSIFYLTWKFLEFVVLCILPVLLTDLVESEIDLFCGRFTINYSLCV